jgi:hypothetical protein
MKLILNKISKGYYSNKIDNIEVSVSEYKGCWTGVIVDWNKSDDEFILCKILASTKNVVVYQLTQYFINN